MVGFRVHGGGEFVVFEENIIETIIGIKPENGGATYTPV